MLEKVNKSVEDEWIKNTAQYKAFKSKKNPGLGEEELPSNSRSTPILSTELYLPLCKKEFLMNFFMSASATSFVDT
eukprot:g66796.t1